MAAVYYPASKEDFEELWKDERYLKRRQEMQSRCKNIAIKNRVDLSRLVYDDYHKVVMCVVPKVRNQSTYDL